MDAFVFFSKKKKEEKERGGEGREEEEKNKRKTTGWCQDSFKSHEHKNSADQVLALLSQHVVNQE